MSKTNSDSSRQGVIYGLIAYTIWGSVPIFFKALHGAPPLEIVSHRVFWSLGFLLLLLHYKHQLGNLIPLLQDRATLRTMCATTLLVGVNWLVFIFAVMHGEILQTSLGYFITPLVNVLLGYIFLRERLNRWQTLSLLLATIGVIYQTLHHGQFPWIALILAGTFGLYGLLRKLANVDATAGLTVETGLLAPIALGYIIFLGMTGQGHFLTEIPRLNFLLPLAGVVTAIPLLLFVAAARRLKLTTIGFLQYLSPSLQFLLAVGLYGEPFSQSQLTSFIFIWAGLAVFSINAIKQNRRAHSTLPIDSDEELR